MLTSCSLGTLCRFLEIYKRKGKDKKAQAQATANKGYQLAVEKLSNI